MMRISTLLAAFAVTLAASALATPSFAQRSEEISSARFDRALPVSSPLELLSFRRS
jgi:hypothetical protein